MSLLAAEPDPYRVSRHAENKITLKMIMLSEIHCKDLIEVFNDCARGRHVSMLWACRAAYMKSQDCIHKYVNDANVAVVRQRWVEGGRERKPNWDVLLAGLDLPADQVKPLS